MSTVKVTDESFDQDVIKSGKPVLVDFWATWCGPCMQIGPSLEQISDDLASELTIAKVNIEDSPDTPSKLGVKGIPTMMLFKNGEIASTKVGACRFALLSADSASAWSKSSPPRAALPPVASTWNTPFCSRSSEMSNVPPPRS